MCMPKISVVIPSYNQAAYLRIAIESVLNQSYVNKELIIIDGGSTDGSIDIIKQYEDHIAYWVSEKDGGQSHAINKGVVQSSGDWINWINSDDALLPGALHAIAKAATKLKGYDIIVGRGVLGDEKGRIKEITIPVNPKVWMPKFCCLGRTCQQSTFWTRRAYDVVGGVRNNIFFRMDTDLYERMLLHGFKVKVCHSMIGFFRIRSNTKSSDNQDVRQKEMGNKLLEMRVTANQQKVAVFLMRCFRIISCHYFRSVIASKIMRNKTLSILWKEYGTSYPNRTGSNQAN